MVIVWLPILTYRKNNLNSMVNLKHTKYYCMEKHTRSNHLSLALY